MNPATAPPQVAAPPSLSDPAVRERLLYQALARLRNSIPNPSARRERAEDVVQECLLRAVKSFNKFNPATGDLGGWLHGILHNVLREDQRRLARQPAATDNTGDWEDLRAKLDPNANLEVVNRLLDKISPKHREVVQMRYLKDLSPEEIAAELGISHGAARVRLSRAMSELKNVAGKEGAR